MSVEFSEMLGELRFIHSLVQLDSQDRVEFESHNFYDWYEYWEAVCRLAELSETRWFEFTDIGRGAIEQAYLSFQNLIRMPDGEIPFPEEEWRNQSFHGQADYPFNPFTKPAAVITIPDA